MFKAKNYVLKMTDGTVLLTYIGDTNGDGVVTQDDVIYLKHYLAGGYNANSLIRP